MRIRARYEALLLIYLWVSALMNAGASGAIELKGGTLDPDGKTIWYDAQYIGIEGKGWEDTEATYNRLPRKAKGVVPQRVWNYGRFPAGLSVRFATDAETVRVRWTLSDEKHNFAHISDIATSGIDLYYRNEQSGKFRYTHADFRTFTPKKLVNTTFFDLPQSQEYELNLPTYRILKRLEIGVPKGKTLSKLPPRDLSKGIVFYGTSITQGGNASRPGLSAVTMVRRKLDVPVVNLGICGNGKMEIEMAELIAELDPAVYVVDCLWNMNMRHVSERVEPFIRKLRETRPNTPLVLAEDSHYDDQPTEKGDMVRNVVEKLIAEGDKNLYFLPNTGMLGDDGDGAVEDRHPNDLGMYRQAEVFINFLGPIMEGRAGTGRAGTDPAGSRINGKRLTNGASYWNEISVGWSVEALNGKEYPRTAVYLIE
jgi:hypothetical protein